MNAWNNLDQPAAQSPLLPHVSTRAKLLAAFVWITVTALLPPQAWRWQLLSLPLLVLASIACGLRPRLFLARLCVLWPLLALISASYLAQPGYPGRLLNLLIKSTFSIWIATLVLAAVPPREFLDGLRQWRVPGIFVQLIAFLFRYARLFSEEAQRMQFAQQARWFRAGKYRTLRERSQCLALLFVRAYERAERIHLSMLARGYASDHARRPGSPAAEKFPP